MWAPTKGWGHRGQKVVVRFQMRLQKNPMGLLVRIVDFPPPEGVEILQTEWRVLIYFEKETLCNN